MWWKGKGLDEGYRDEEIEDVLDFLLAVGAGVVY